MKSYGFATRRSRLRRRMARNAAWARGVAEPVEPRLLLANFLVTNADDSGAGSFRQALIDATATSAADTIAFDTAGVFSSPRTISLLTALPQIAAGGGGLTISGPGAANLTIRRDPGAASFRIFDSAAPTLIISGLTVSGGKDASGGVGGGLAVSAADANVTLNAVVFTGNNTFGSGGAIGFADEGFLTLRNSTLSGNIAGQSGGGIYFFSGGSFLIENSTLSGNAANSVVPGEGGA